MTDFTITVGSREPAPRLQPKKAEPPWPEAFAIMQAPILRLEKLDLEREAALQLVENRYLACAHLIYKKRWNNRHKMPFSKTECANAEPLADVLLAYLNLTIELHAIGAGPHYPYAMIWFQGIFNEMLASSIESVSDVRQTKQDCVDALRALTNKLHNGCNPFDPDREPHHYRLIAAAQKVIAGQRADTAMGPRWIGSFKHGSNKIKGLIPALRTLTAYIRNEQSEVLKVYDGKVVALQPGRAEPKTLCDILPRDNKFGAL